MKRVMLPVVPVVEAPQPVPVTVFPDASTPTYPMGDGRQHPLQVVPPEQASDPIFALSPAAALPPPPVAVAPEGFQGFMDAALAARGTSLSHSLFWAQMAQAVATAEVADRLEELVEFLGARDGALDDAAPPRLSEAIADGIVMAQEHREQAANKPSNGKPKK